MKIGFTGSREGTTPDQHHALCGWVAECDPRPTELHHGCCVGADSEMFDVFREYAAPARVIAHPPDRRGMVCGNAEEFSDERRPPLPYLDRNRAIVDACDVLVACPKGPEEVRSGTWATVRYARRLKRRVVIIWPDGRVEDSGRGNG